MDKNALAEQLQNEYPGAIVHNIYPASPDSIKVKNAQWRAAALLIPRGEFSIVIAGLAATSAFAVELQALTLTYVILTTLVSSIIIRQVNPSRAEF